MKKHKLFSLAMFFVISLGFVSAEANKLSDSISKNYFELCGNLENSRIRFTHDKTGSVAFLGGSITEMDGYRPIVCAFLANKFPETRFDFINAGIGSTCSTTGAFRLQHDVLSQGRIDLLFVEFAVNDKGDAFHAAKECIRGMEGIVRLARRNNPCMDIVFLYTTDPSSVADFQNGVTPMVIASHHKVAAHYKVSDVYLAWEIADLIKEGQLDWNQFGGVHPALRGNKIYAQRISKFLDSAWSGTLDQDSIPAPYFMPKEPLDKFNYGQGRYIEHQQVFIVNDWHIGVPKWGEINGQKLERFRQIPLLWAEKPGATLSLSFSGTAVGVYVVAGLDAGMVEFSIDGKPFKKVDLYHPFSDALHYPRTCIFDADLEPGPHKLTLRVADTKNPASTGHAARIVSFVAN